MSETRGPIFEQVQADGSHARFNEKISTIAARLRDIADEVEREGLVRPAAELISGRPPHAWAAQQVQHSVLWGVVNLNIDGLTGSAADADQAAIVLADAIAAALGPEG